MSKVNFIYGNIVKIELLNKSIPTPVDVIVNPTSKSMLPVRGKVNKKIHRTAGSQLTTKCKELSPCYVGEVKETEGYNLPVSYIFHTVGPVYEFAESCKSQTETPEALLASCYRNCLELAIQKGCKSIVFPTIQYGHFGFPMDVMATVAYETCESFKEQLEITFVFRRLNELDEFKSIYNSCKKGRL